MSFADATRQRQETLRTLRRESGSPTALGQQADELASEYRRSLMVRHAQRMGAAAANARFKQEVAMGAVMMTPAGPFVAAAGAMDSSLPTGQRARYGGAAALPLAGPVVRGVMGPALRTTASVAHDAARVVAGGADDVARSGAPPEKVFHYTDDATVTGFNQVESVPIAYVRWVSSIARFTLEPCAGARGDGPFSSVDSRCGKIKLWAERRLGRLDGGPALHVFVRLALGVAGFYGQSLLAPARFGASEVIAAAIPPGAHVHDVLEPRAE